MIAYTIRRVLLMFPLLLAVATVTFFLMHAVTGGPFDTNERPESAATRQRLEARYDLSGSLGSQYANYLKNLAQGDLGISFTNNRPVRDIIGERFARIDTNGGGFPLKIGVTLQLGICAFIFAMTLGLSLGIISAVNQNGVGDYTSVFVATVGAALPPFILSPFLVILFSLKFGWFDVLGWEFGNYHKMVLPMVALGLLPGAFIARITRASMLDVLRSDYIRTARAKGVKEFAVVMRHAFRNAMIPVLTIMGPLFATLITGSFIIDRAFAIPGLGQTFIEAIQRRDYGVIMGVTLFLALIFALINLTVDLAYAAADPRIRL